MTDLWDRTNNELRKIAASEGILVEGDDNKADLVAKILLARGKVERSVKDQEPPEHVREKQERLRGENKKRSEQLAKRQRRR